MDLHGVMRSGHRSGRCNLLFLLELSLLELSIRANFVWDAALDSPAVIRILTSATDTGARRDTVCWHGRYRAGLRNRNLVFGVGFFVLASLASEQSEHRSCGGPKFRS